MQMKSKRQSKPDRQTIPIVWLNHAWQVDVGIESTSGGLGAGRSGEVVSVVGAGCGLRHYRILPPLHDLSDWEVSPGCARWRNWLGPVKSSWRSNGRRVVTTRDWRIN